MLHGVDVSWLWSLSLHRVGVAVTCCTVWGVVVTVVAPCRVSWLRLLCHVGCHGCGCCAVWGVAVAVFVQCAVSGCCLCATCGVVVAVVALWGVLWSLHCVQCHSCCVAWGVAAIVPCAVSQLWCCSCSRCAVCDVAVVEGRGWPCVYRQGRWEVGGGRVLRSEVEKKNKTTYNLRINIFVFLNLCEFVSWCVHAPLPWMLPDPNRVVTPSLYHVVSILSPRSFPCNWRLGLDTGHQNKSIGTILVSWALNLGVGQSLRIYSFKECLFRLF